jgi:hypothetical protein
MDLRHADCAPSQVSEVAGLESQDRRRKNPYEARKFKERRNFIPPISAEKCVWFRCAVPLSVAPRRCDEKHVADLADQKKALAITALRNSEWVRQLADQKRLPNTPGQWLPLGNSAIFPVCLCHPVPTP